ncbi:MAG: glycosidase [Phycisphaerae bacterium]|nr:glycosidase [Phycisphaerae bacterium]
MSDTIYHRRRARLTAQYEELITRPNRPVLPGNGIYFRYEHPAVTRDHVPPTWIYDFDEKDNPFFMQRLGVNSTFNSGAMVKDGRIVLVVRVEGFDRKSFFAIAESETGVDNFRFHEKPVVLPVSDDPETNVYDMRLTQHEDGWIYGVFCAERKDRTEPNDPSAARADAGIVRTKDLRRWERLPDLKSGPQQRNVILHPEFVDGQYAFYTRPADSFIDTGSQTGIGWALVDDIEHAEIRSEKIIDQRIYHTVKEAKNGGGPTPIKTRAGWLHVAHGVRNQSCGLRYVLYAFMTSLEDPSRVIYRPGGHFFSAYGDERRGDTTGNIFSCGAAMRDSGEVFIYFGESDTRLGVVTSTEDQLIDYCKNTPEDPLFSHKCVQQRVALIEKNSAHLGKGR